MSDSTAERTSVFNAQDPQSTLLSVNMSSVTKLTNLNYLMWSRQVRALLEGHELQHFIDPTDSAPPQTIQVNGVSTQNPAYAPWRRQDRLLYSSLIGAISLPIQPVVSSATTTKDVWDMLAMTFGNPTRGHIRQLKFQIKQCVKGTQTISEYLRSIKSKADDLALLGKPMDHEDLTEQILAGLSEEYKPEIDAINGRDTPISYSELHERLLNREGMILCSESQQVTPVVANATDTRQRQQGRNANHYGNHSSQHQQGRNANHYGHHSSQPRFNNNPNRVSKPYMGRCHACGTQGHSAKFCPEFRIVRGALSHQPPSHPSQSWQPSPQYQSWRPSANNAIMSDSSTWLLDSGASHHMTSDLHNLAMHNPYSGGDDVLLGDGSGLKISHSGSLSLPSYTKPFFLNNVLCVPSLEKNLLSVFQLCTTNGVAVTFTPTYFQVRDLQTGTLRLEGTPKGGTYQWPKSTSLHPPSLAYASAVKTSLTDWHSRLGHPAFPILQKVVSKFNLPIVSNGLMAQPCYSCSINKMHKLPFQNSSLRSMHPLDILFSDVWTSPIISNDGFKYYVIFVDHYTRYTWLYPLKQKSQVFEVFTRFKVLVENQFQTKLKTLYSDNGGEYIGLATFLASHGIAHKTSPPHTPEHNGIAERRHRHIVETGLSLLSHASIPKSFWTYAFATAVYLINRMPTSVLDFNNPFQKLYGHPPNFEKLKNFGCLCFPWIRPYASNKLDARSTPCVFIGYSVTQSAYFCLDRETSRIYTSRHVVFHENVFPFSVKITPHVDDEVSSFQNQVSPIATIVPIFSPPNITPAPSPQPSSPDHVTPHPTPTSDTDSLSPPSPPVAPELPPAPPAPTRQSTRPRKPVQKLNLHTTVKHITEIPPTTVAQALKSPHWRQAMSDEFMAQTGHRTWELVELTNATNNVNVVGCRWIFTIKRNADGTVARYKARLVAKGFTQRLGIDYNETFSPVVKPDTIRSVLSVAVTYDWPLRQLDVNNAFLQGTLNDEVYMVQPPGFIDKYHPNAVCKLRKAIYGLKQAPRAWYNELRKFLIQHGFSNSLADASLFIYNKQGVLIYMLVYVDDLIITGNTPSKTNQFIESLSNRFSLKDLDDLSFFLGMEVTRSKDGLHLTQTRYIADLLHRTKMDTCKPTSTPMCPNTQLTLRSGVVLDDAAEYRSVVGSLQYLSLTRPDISFSVNKLSQFMHHPTIDHWNAVKRILRYLAGTMMKGILLRRNNKLMLHAFTDADWGGNTDDYTSTGAYVVYLGQHPIAWSTKKQTGVSRSSTEAEYRSLANTTSELCWIMSLFKELGVPSLSSPVIYCDNIGATYLAANPVFHSRMKHIALDYHFVRQFIQSGQLRVSHVSTDDQLADALTKPLPRPRFERLTFKIGLWNPRPS